MYFLLLSCALPQKQDSIATSSDEVQINIKENRWVDDGLLLQLAVQSTTHHHPLHKVVLTAGRYHQEKDLSGITISNDKTTTIQWTLPLQKNNIFILQGQLEYGNPKRKLGFSVMSAPTRNNQTKRKLEDK